MFTAGSRQTFERWIKFESCPVLRKSHMRELFAVTTYVVCKIYSSDAIRQTLCGPTRTRWRTGRSVQEARVGCSVQALHKRSVSETSPTFETNVFAVQPRQFLAINCTRTSTCTRGLQIYVRRTASHCVVGTKLLLPMWQYGIDINSAGGWRSAFHGLWSCT